MRWLSPRRRREPSDDRAVSPMAAPVAGADEGRDPLDHMSKGEPAPLPQAPSAAWDGRAAAWPEPQAAGWDGGVGGSAEPQVAGWDGGVAGSAEPQVAGWDGGVGGSAEPRAAGWDGGVAGSAEPRAAGWDGGVAGSAEPRAAGWDGGVAGSAEPQAGWDGGAPVSPEPPAAGWDAGVSNGDIPPRRRPRRKRRTLAIAAAAALVGAGALAAAVPVYRAVAQNVPGIHVTAQNAADANNAPVAIVFQKLAPSVVLVTNQSNPQGFTGTQQTAWGSGVIFDPSGYIVTNDHVVAGASQVTVTLNNGSSYPAHIVGGDPSTDLAVIKISVPATTTLQAATFADSKDVVPGQVAIAIGNPLGPQFEQSVTQGIVGAVRPMLYGLNGASPRVTELIQTDAPINPGNSGGALANIDGQVIGITTLKVPQTGEYGVPATGLGFAIPSDTVSQIVNQIMQFGYVKRSYIGVVIQPTPGSALPTQSQTLTVTQVEAGGPAASAGMQQGDVLTSWNGQQILNYYQLVEDINNSQPGDTVTVGVERNGSAVSLQIALGAVPQSQEQLTPASQQGGGSGSAPTPGTPFPFPFPFGP